MKLNKMIFNSYRKAILGTCSSRFAWGGVAVLPTAGTALCARRAVNTLLTYFALLLVSGSVHC